MTGVLLNRALTIRQPWAWAVANGWKDVENRSWRPGYTGILYVHSGLVEPGEPDLSNPQVKEAMYMASQYDPAPVFKLGYVLGTVELGEVHHSRDCQDMQGVLCSAWALPNNYHWKLTNARPLSCPFPEKGKQGLWRF